jgi:hypothetical protein
MYIYIACICIWGICKYFFLHICTYKYVYLSMYTSTCTYILIYTHTCLYTGEVVSAAFQQCYNKLNITSKTNEITPKTVKRVDYKAKNHPLPLTAQQSLENKIILALLASLFILVPLCYIPASFITFLVKERVSKAKHLQLVSSISPSLYWIATYVWDVMLFTILVCIIMIVFFIYGKKAAQIFISVDEATLAVFCLLFTYGLSVLPMCYLLSMLFTNFSTGMYICMHSCIHS